MGNRVPVWAPARRLWTVDEHAAPAPHSRPMRNTSPTGMRACAVLLALVVGAAYGGSTRSRVETPASANMSEYRSYGWWRQPLNEGPRGQT